MRYTSEMGRSMLETIMVMAIMGILSVTGIYLYQKAMNDVRADGMVKDVLERASQKKSNEDLKRLASGKRVYAPEYKRYKKDGSGTETTRGRYGYRYEIMPESDSTHVVVQTEGNSINGGLCQSLKGKFIAYKKNTFQKVMVVEDDKETIDILTQDCPKDILVLRFYVKYGEISGGVVKPAPADPKLEGECPAGSTTGGYGDPTGIYKGGVECRCISGTAHWTGGECVVCASIQTWNPDTKMCEPPLICPPNSSTFGEGDATNVEGCKCDTPTTRWNSIECVLPCPTSSPVPMNACYDVVNHSAVDGCPSYTTYTTKACVCSAGYGLTACTLDEVESAQETLADGTICYECMACPPDSSQSGDGEETNVVGCKCKSPKTHWSGSLCEETVCPDGTDEYTKEDGTKECCPKENPIWNGSLCTQCTQSNQCKGVCPVCMAGKCLDSEEVVVPQHVMFAHTSSIDSKEKIVALGPYKCSYDIYVKGHIDDTFLVENAENGTSLCIPKAVHSTFGALPAHTTQPGSARMVDGILYRLPPNTTVNVYAYDIYGGFVAWEKDRTEGGSWKTPSAGTMKLIRSSQTSSYCNGNI